MALSDEILQTIRDQVRSQVRPVVFRGAVQGVGPTQVVIDGSSQAVTVATDDEYIPVIGDRVYVVQTGTDFILVGKIIPAGQPTRPSLNGGYAEAYISADQLNWATNLQMPLALGPNSDPGWTISGGSHLNLIPPAGIKGLWRMSVSMRYATSTASSTTSTQAIEGNINMTSPTRVERLCAAQAHGHAITIEKDMHAISPIFDITQVNVGFGLTAFSSLTTATNNCYQQTWTPLAPYNVTAYATYMALWRVR